MFLLSALVSLHPMFVLSIFMFAFFLFFSRAVSL